MSWINPNYDKTFGNQWCFVKSIRIDQAGYAFQFIISCQLKTAVASRYCDKGTWGKSGDYLKAGDILLNDNHHVAIAVTTGAKVSTPSTTLTGTFQTRLPILRKGSSGTAVAMLQAMLGVEVDGQFGNDTYDSLKVFQKNVGVKANGTCGIDTWKRVIEHMKANTK